MSEKRADVKPQELKEDGAAAVSIGGAAMDNTIPVVRRKPKLIYRKMKVK